MKLYHGTSDRSAQSIILDGIKFELCDEYTDNGRGFYLSQEREFAEYRAKVMTLSPDKPTVIEMYFDEDNATSKLNIRHYLEETDEWKFFVSINRLGSKYYKIMNEFFPGKPHNLDKKYDVVIDTPADARISDRMYQIECELDNCIRGRGHIDSRQKIANLIHSITIGSGSATAKQVSFHTNTALGFLKFV